MTGETDRARQQFVDTFAQRWGIAVAQADRMLRRVEVAYGEEHNSKLRDEVDTMAMQLMAITDIMRRHKDTSWGRAEQAKRIRKILGEDRGEESD